MSNGDANLLQPIPRRQRYAYKYAMSRLTEFLSTNRLTLIVFVLCIATLATVYRPDVNGTELYLRVNARASSEVKGAKASQLGYWNRCFYHAATKEYARSPAKSIRFIALYRTIFPPLISHGIFPSPDQRHSITECRDGSICAESGQYIYLSIG